MGVFAAHPLRDDGADWHHTKSHQLHAYAQRLPAKPVRRFPRTFRQQGLQHVRPIANQLAGVPVLLLVVFGGG